MQELIERGLKAAPEHSIHVLAFILANNGVDHRIKPYVDGMISLKSHAELAKPSHAGVPLVSCYNGDKPDTLYFNTPYKWDKLQQAWTYKHWSVNVHGNIRHYGATGSPNYDTEAGQSFIDKWFSGYDVELNWAHERELIVTGEDDRFSDIKPHDLFKYKSAKEYLASL